MNKERKRQQKFKVRYKRKIENAEIRLYEMRAQNRQGNKGGRNA